MFTLSLSRWFICVTSFILFQRFKRSSFPLFIVLFISLTHTSSFLLTAMAIAEASKNVGLHCFRLVVINLPNDSLQSCIIPEYLKKQTRPFGIRPKKKSAIGNFFYIFHLVCEQLQPYSVG